MKNEPVPSPLRKLAAELADVKPMRRGSLSERMVKCSQPGCSCREDPNARHGPYFSLTRAVRGKTQSRLLTKEQATVARQQIEAGHEFRTKLESFWEGCEAWADSELSGSPTASTEEAEKGGSERTSKTKLSRKSRGS
jgi:hypothetical protein